MAITRSVSPLIAPTSPTTMPRTGTPSKRASEVQFVQALQLSSVNGEVLPDLLDPGGDGARVLDEVADVQVDPIELAEPAVHV